ncbi:hypothetical protein [Peterkaempfera griseoplana]|nr:hypothetical protein [Peterkaempfera griseoplana]
MRCCRCGHFLDCKPAAALALVPDAAAHRIGVRQIALRLCG